MRDLQTGEEMLIANDEVSVSLAPLQAKMLMVN
jgi:hypothetical protein